MKKLLSLLLSLALILTLAACGNTPDAPVAPTDDVTDVGITEIATESGGNSTTTESVVTETVTDQSGKPVTQPDGKPVTTVITTKPASGSGSASVSAPTYTGKTTNKTTNKSTNKTNSTLPYDPTGTTLSLTPEQRLIDSAFALTGSQTLQGTISGTVVDVREAYSDRYKNATFTIRVVGGYVQEQDLLCYRCTPAAGSATDIAIGQTVTVTGTLKNYKGTIEFDKGSYTVKGGAAVTTTTTRPISSGAIDPDGIYDSKEEVALYIHTYGRLPKNYITKSQYKAQGKPRDKTCGGDRFYNNEGLLPSGYTYYECDIDTLGTTNRGAKRIVWTTSGIVYYTSDHYASFTKLYGER